MWLNEIEPYAVAWLRNFYPEAMIDDRDIRCLTASDIPPGTCHLFAGIGGWPDALSLADWPDSEPIWTASLPCQPFSDAGRHEGVLDERHLWASFHRLVAECHPPIIVGEQVAGRAGRAWLAGVRTDLEELGYAVGAADLCAAGVGAPHPRQRLFWVAESQGARLPIVAGQHKFSAQSGSQWGGEAGGLADSDRGRCERFRLSEPQRLEGTCRREPVGSGSDREFNVWADVEWLRCLDGKVRRTQPGLRPLAHGVFARASKLRAYGNAIVPQVAAEFVRAYRAARWSG